MSPPPSLQAEGGTAPFGRRTRLLAALVALLVGAILAAAVLLALHYERNEKDEALHRATDAAVAGIRAVLHETELSLSLLAVDLQRHGGSQRLDRVAAELLANDAALLRLELRGEAGELIEAVEASAPRPRLGAAEREALGFEATLALRSAIGFKRPLYSRPYFVQLGDTTGFEVMDLAVPVPVAASGRGEALLAIYSMPRLLDRMLPSTLLQAHQVYLTEADGTFVARASSGLHGAGVYTAASPLELPGISLQLRTNSMLGLPKLIPNLLTAMLIVVTLALAASGALLWRDWRLRARAERALRDEHAFRKAMEDSLFTGLQARDLAGRITYVNPAFCRMTGYPAGELVGCSPPMPYWPPECGPRAAGGVRDGAHGQDPRRSDRTRACTTEGYEVEFVRRDGERFPALIFEAPLIDEHGRQSGWMASILDLSEQKRVEELNRRQQEQLQAKSRMALLGEIASALSHELNQPLAAITSYATACENLLPAGEASAAARGGRHGADPAAIRAALGRIRTQSERAGQVIRSVQDFIRRRRVDNEIVCLEGLLRSVEPLVRLQALKAGGRLEWRCDPSVAVCGDRTMLEQVLLNLTRNAYEAMDGTPAQLRLLEIVAGQREDGGRPFVEVELRDRGKGVPVELEAQLFNAFFTTKPDGLGIGLSLCRSVIEAHAGNLSYLPRPGGGAIFRFELPAVAAPAARRSLPALPAPTSEVAA